MIIEQIYVNKERGIKQSPVNSNRASDLGIPCVRYHVLNRTKWQERSLHNAALQLTFDIGNVMENAILRDIQDAGFQVIEQQRAFSWPEYQITGHLDAKVVVNGEAIPIEIKTSSPYVFKSINTIHDLTNGKYGYLRKYPAQLTLYCLMGNHEKGIFLFKDKSSGAMKEIEMPLDYELGETLLKRAEEINAHIAAGTLPDPINEDMWCDRCPFTHICLKDRIGNAPEIIDNVELENILTRMDELKPLAKEFEDLDKQKKEMLEGREKLLCGNYFITGKWMERKGYNVPDEIKKQYPTITRYWKSTIMNMAAEAGRRTA